MILEPPWRPLVLGSRADMCALTARLADALSLVDQAAALAGADNWLSASFMLQKGDLLLAMGDAGGAEVSLRRAIDEARRLSGRMLLLQAATRLARVPQPARRHDAIPRCATSSRPSPRASTALTPWHELWETAFQIA